ncbi:MAG: AMP-binding protein, partial [Pyramidobacter sp.]
MAERLEELLIEKLKKRSGGKDFWWEGRWIDATEMLEHIESDRQVLIKSGFQPGQRLMTLMPNCPALVELAIAVWSLRGTLIPLNMRAGTDNLLPTIDLVQPFGIVIARDDLKAA